jgi:hypothetical protein
MNSSSATGCTGCGGWTRRAGRCAGFQAAIFRRRSPLTVANWPRSLSKTAITASSRCSTCPDLAMRLHTRPSAAWRLTAGVGVRPDSVQVLGETLHIAAAHSCHWSALFMVCDLAEHREKGAGGACSARSSGAPANDRAGQQQHNRIGSGACRRRESRPVAAGAARGPEGAPPPGAGAGEADSQAPARGVGPEEAPATVMSGGDVSAALLNFLVGALATCEGDGRHIRSCHSLPSCSVVEMKSPTTTQELIMDARLNLLGQPGRNQVPEAHHLGGQGGRGFASPGGHAAGAAAPGPGALPTTWSPYRSIQTIWDPSSGR